MDESRYREAEQRLWAASGVTPTERFVRLSRRGPKVRVLEVGEGPPALFVHGGPSSGVGWAPLAARISGLRCIVLDRPRTGLSDPMRWRRDTLREEFETLVVDVLDALDIDKAHLVGSSTGSDLRGGGMLPSLVFTAEDLAAIESPTYFLWGDNDVFADVQIGRGMLEQMRNARLEVLPGGGHLPWLDDPERAADVTRAHLLDEAAEVVRPTV